MTSQKSNLAYHDRDRQNERSFLFNQPGQYHTLGPAHSYQEGVNVDKQRQTYSNGWHDGYQAAHDSYQEHEAAIYATAFASGMRAGNWQANQSITKNGWAEQ